MSRNGHSGKALATVGVDIGGTSTRTVVFDETGQPVHTTHSRTPWGPGPLVDHVCDEISAAAGARTVTLVGVGVPGAVRDGTVTMALNVGIDEPLAIADQLRERLGVPVTVENDVNAAALGAHLHLDGESSASLAYLSIGTGVAAGLVIDGQIVRGARGVAGEIGHIALPDRLTRCVCGQIGCIETVASGSAIRAAMDAAGIAGDAVDLWDLADSGTAAAAEIRDDAVAALAWASYLTLMLVDVERVVIGGGVGIALGDRIVAPIRKALGEVGSGSPFLASLDLDGRVIAAPQGVELGALGADRAARRANGWQAAP